MNVFFFFALFVSSEHFPSLMAQVTHFKDCVYHVAVHPFAYYASSSGRFKSLTISRKKQSHISLNSIVFFKTTAVTKGDVEKMKQRFEDVLELAIEDAALMKIGPDSKYYFGYARVSASQYLGDMEDEAVMDMALAHPSVLFPHDIRNESNRNFTVITFGNIRLLNPCYAIQAKCAPMLSGVTKTDDDNLSIRRQCSMARCMLDCHHSEEV